MPISRGVETYVAAVRRPLRGNLNCSWRSAQAAPAPVAFNGTISKPDETKYFKFAAKKGQVFDVHCYARRLGSPLDPVMHISDAAPNNALGTYRTGADDAVG